MGETILTEIRQGAYYDSIVLMQLQASLVELPGVRDAAAVMAVPANVELLERQGLLEGPVRTARAEDLVIVVRASDEPAARAALSRVDDLLRRRSRGADDTIRPKSLRGALSRLPASRWVLVSVPGRYAAGVAREAVEAGRNVFLYSDNVAVEDEIELKELARERGVLLLGPDCGTTMIGGIGFGFANRVRPGPVGLVAASGTGLQAVAAELHRLGSGISAALGTGGRDLGEDVRGATTHRALEALAADAATRAIGVISKPPARCVVPELLAHAAQVEKPVVFYLQGAVGPIESAANLRFARSLDEAARMLAALAAAPTAATTSTSRMRADGGRRYLRGLFAGGTLAAEIVVALRWYLPSLCANVSVAGVGAPASLATSAGHTVLDLGDDAFTVGRLHPMLDATLRRERFAQEAGDPEVAAIVLDFVLGDGAQEDPVGPFLEPIAAAVASGVRVIALLVGTDEDPQRRDEQETRLAAVGASVWHSTGGAAVAALAATLPPARARRQEAVSASDLAPPVIAVNVGLSVFAEAARARGAEVVDVDWRPPAGGNERLAGILAKLRSGS